MLNLPRSESLLASAARTATVNATRRNPGARGAVLVLDVTAVPGVDTVTLVVRGRDVISGRTWTILQAAARSTVGTDVLRLYPGLSAVANQVANDCLPEEYQYEVTHSGAGSFTYSLGVAYLP